MQGGGCTSFANAIVEHAAVPFPLRSLWERQVHIQADLMGFNQTAIDNTANVEYMGPVIPSRNVPLLTPLSRDTWADSNDTSATVFNFYDPELFYLTSSFARNALLKSQGEHRCQLIVPQHYTQ